MSRDGGGLSEAGSGFDRAERKTKALPKRRDGHAPLEVLFAAAADRD
ncbi:hypothetical protein WJ0W_001297 [Paenibacillus melissococcoides]|uniref:Uncharacterized protein n=1 Tax=Paenibacillus melissococcoides TaxID=2912268 RepID=A0ABN8TZC2_9BACL|nr:MULTISPECIES: hypothetical protein [Paenibacillus]MEB9894959.1 hypothetical protein [Bacillus cereus]CAH8244058.1 hypothetical protein WJ0W_001297 [Paenibacillus melissococcoides]CAH8703944.1 hypothetical protein HTL2_000363 [Paenibacillus melissococcoides]CAH8706575.1 hypothetical protein WDD9_001325 [Paenibacillus melissococcoides]